MSNEQLLRLAVEEAGGLTPEAVELLRAELSARRFDPDIETAVANQANQSDPTLDDSLVQAVQAGPCPSCGRSDAPLNGFEIHEVRGYLFRSVGTRVLFIGCSPCVEAAASRATRNTAIFGWWSLPFGALHALLAIVRNRHARHARDVYRPTSQLRDFVRAHRGAATLLAKGRLGEFLGARDGAVR